MRQSRAAALTIGTLAFGLYLRFVGIPDVFCHSPDEFSEIMPGLRLHALAFPGLHLPIRYSFLQSMFYSQHGLGDVSLYYLASAALSGVGLPVSEHWLYVIGGGVNIALAVAGAAFAAIVIDSALTGWIFASLVFVSPFYVFVSKTGWARLSWSPLLFILLLVLQDRALQRPRWIPTALFWLLGAFVALTDAFIMLPIVPVAAVWATPAGSFRDRVRYLLRSPVFLIGLALMAAALSVDVVLGVLAHRRHTDLTMVGYLLLRGATGSWLPRFSSVRTWAACVDAYLPIRGGWILVAIAFGLAVRDARRGSPIGIVAAWWALASLGVMRYAEAAAPGALNAYYLAPPTFLLLAWLLSRSPARVATAIGAALLVPLAVQAHVAAFDERPRFGVRVEDLVHHTEMPVSTCRVVKAAAFYIRTHEQGLPFVFHLSSDGWNIYLGHIAEFYDGLSYGRSSQPEEANHLFDFAANRFGQQVPPDAFARAYGIAHFDYYVDFLDEPDRAHVKPATIARLERDGARVVCTIRDGGRPIGRIFAFSSVAATDLDYRDAAASWDAMFARAATLLQQPIAGSAYHFGYNWRTPIF